MLNGTHETLNETHAFCVRAVDSLDYMAPRSFCGNGNSKHMDMVVHRRGNFFKHSFQKGFQSYLMGTLAVARDDFHCFASAFRTTTQQIKEGLM